MSNTTRLAVLIDAENVSHRLVDRVFDQVGPLGTVLVRRIYGDFAGSAQGWAAAAARHALAARHCFAPAKGKSGSDIAMAIDAVDLLRDRAVDGFCIVSSDGDFAALAQRIRAEGCLAIGIGMRVASAGYRDACTRFIVLDPPPAASAPNSPESALPAIRKALANCTPAANGWFHLGTFGTAARAAGIVPQSYGAPRLGALLKATNQYTFLDDQHFRPAPAIRAVAGRQ